MIFINNGSKWINKLPASEPDWTARTDLRQFHWLIAFVQQANYAAKTQGRCEFSPEEVYHSQRSSISRQHVDFFALSQTSRRLKVKEELFRSCPVLSPPSPGVQEGSKGVGWALWVVQVVMVKKISGLLKN